MTSLLITIFAGTCVLLGGGFIGFVMYRRVLREAKNYERGLKMVPILIHLPPASDDIDGGGRDQRDLTEEVLSQAQVMYNIISSTALKGFKSKIYGQRHISFEIIARDGIVYYYAVVPTVLTDVIKQSIAAAYPSARLEEVIEHNVFSQKGMISGTIGGEFTLKKHFSYPISTYMESKRDASRALLNAISAVGKEDGIGIQFLLRPAGEGWSKVSAAKADKIVKDKGIKSGGLSGVMPSKDILEALWKPPHSEEKHDERQLNQIEQATVDAIQDKLRYPGYEVLIRVVVSSNSAARSQALLKNVVAAFSLFDSPNFNGFRFSLAKDIEEFVTSFIFRFFPQSVNQNILNSIELSTVFHLPDQKSIPTSQVKRQMSKQVDGPTEVMEQGLLLGFNEFRGVKKPIRVSDKDRRRHIHVIGQTGVGKSVLQENLAFQDMMDGRGFAFVDPHGDSVEALLSKIPKERVEDVIYFNPSDMDNPIGLNMFEFDNPDQKDFLVQEAINMLYGLYDPGHTGIVGPRLEHIFRNCALLLMADPAGGTFIDIPKVLVDEQFMKSKLKYVTDQQVLDFWTKEFPASQRSSDAGEVISWVVAKFGPFISNDAMRNIIGQTKSGFDIRHVMDNNKILLVNLSKGKMGELNSRLLGIIFVMKFQAAAMARANQAEEDRKDFTLYVDEFQNFATDSFETILSEARKYRLSLVLGNQFMTQLKDEIREAIIGNVGTSITGRIGITDAEIMVKKYTPTFDAEDLTKLPNFESVAVAQIQGVPSAPFSMSWIPSMGQANMQLSDALKRLSAAKYGRPRAEVERDIFARLRPPAAATTSSGPVRPGTGAPAPPPTVGAAQAKPNKSSFLDEWLEKRRTLNNSPPTSVGSNVGPRPSVPSAIQQQDHNPIKTAMAPTIAADESFATGPTQSRPEVIHTPAERFAQPQRSAAQVSSTPAPGSIALGAQSAAVNAKPNSDESRLSLRGESSSDSEELTVKLR